MISHMDAYPTSSSIFSHRKSSTTKLDESLTNKDTTADVHETLPNRSTDLQSSWILSSRPTVLPTTSLDGDKRGKYLLANASSGPQQQNKMLAIEESLVSSAAVTASAASTWGRRPLPTDIHPALRVALSHTLSQAHSTQTA